MNTPTTEKELLERDNTSEVRMWEALERLQKLDDFKLVIEEGYFKDKAVDGVSLLATDYIVDNGLRNRVMESLVAISHLRDYFHTIEALGNIPPEDDDEE